MRNTYIVGGGALIIIVIGILAFLSGSKNNSSPAITATPAVAVAVPFTELAQGVKSSVATRTNYLITSASELEKLWKMVDAKGNPPAVDFSKYSVAAVFAGAQATDGYTISVSKVEDTTVRTLITTIVQPGSSCTPKHSTTTPYEIISLATTSLTFTHQDQATTTECK